MTPRQVREVKAKKAKAYKEFEDWAVRELANNVITSGFRELRGTVQMIVHAYRSYEREYPEIKEE